MRKAKAGPPAEPDRLDFLEGIRGVLAVYVVLGHLCSMADPSHLAGKPSRSPEWLRFVMAPFGFGHLAVAGFIVISGFCLEMSIFRRSRGQLGLFSGFYRRRARRILPPYYAALALSIAVSLTVTSRLADRMPFAMYLPITVENVLAHVFLVHNFRLDWMYKLNGVLWSIAIEAQLYLFFPFLVRSFERVGRWPTWIGSVVLAGLALRYVPDAMKLYPWFAPLFILGMLSAWAAYRPNIESGVHPDWGWGLMALAAAACVTACVLPTDLVARDFPMGAMVAALCYSGAVTDGGGLAKLFSWKPLVALGGFSYSLYLVHHPIQQIVYWFRPAFVKDEVTTFAYLVAMLPVLLFASYLFAKVFESAWRKKQAVPIVDTALPRAPTQLPLRPFR
jgi:peptidoglycan/LPS O-acetylase OafA/YrhL